MKVLFVASANKHAKLNPIVRNQADSLLKSGIELDFFYIRGKGIVGYLINIFKLKNYLKQVNCNLIHAHYSLSGIISFFAKKNETLVVSLMGSDVKVGIVQRKLILFFNRYLWDGTIIKSNSMLKDLPLRKYRIIPNGVDLEIFIPMDKLNCRRKIGLSDERIIIGYFANPARREKNFDLLEQSLSLLECVSDIEILIKYDIDPKVMPYYLNACDLIALPSLWEGSPNIVKEAMACNVSVIATDVGDIALLFNRVHGYFISDSNPKAFSETLQQALNFARSNSKVNGRSKIIESGLDAEFIASELQKYYLDCKSAS